MNRDGLLSILTQLLAADRAAMISLFGHRVVFEGDHLWGIRLPIGRLLNVHPATPSWRSGMSTTRPRWSISSIDILNAILPWQEQLKAIYDDEGAQRLVGLKPSIARGIGASTSTSARSPFEEANVWPTGGTGFPDCTGPGVDEVARRRPHKWTDEEDQSLRTCIHCKIPLPRPKWAPPGPAIAKPVTSPFGPVPEVSRADTLAVLNVLVTADTAPVQAIFDHRVRVNAELVALDCDVVCGGPEATPTLGLLGVINGALGWEKRIAAEYSDDGKLMCFTVAPPGPRATYDPTRVEITYAEDAPEALSRAAARAEDAAKIEDAARIVESIEGAGGTVIAAFGSMVVSTGGRECLRGPLPGEVVVFSLPGSDTESSQEALARLEADGAHTDVSAIITQAKEDLAARAEVSREILEGVPPSGLDVLGSKRR